MKPEDLLGIQRREAILVLIATGTTPEEVVEHLDAVCRRAGRRNRIKLHTIEKWRNKYQWSDDDLAELGRLAEENGADSAIVMQRAGELATATRPYQKQLQEVADKVMGHMGEMEGKDLFNDITKVAAAARFSDDAHGFEKPEQPKADLGKNNNFLVAGGDIVVGEKENEPRTVEADAEVVEENAEACRADDSAKDL